MLETLASHSQLEVRSDQSYLPTHRLGTVRLQRLEIAVMQKQFKVANISAARGKRYGVIEAVLSHPGRYMIGNSKYPLVEFSVYAACKQAREKLVDLERRACHWRRC